jgi:hypothetical protein
MTRWMTLGMFLVLAAGLGCQKDQSTSQAAAVYDQLSVRETAYHTAVGRLPDGAAVQTETSAYTSDMHGLLEDMHQACTEMMHGGSMMGSHDLADMTEVMDQMRGCIDDYNSHMQGMDPDSLEAMRVACNEHHQAMGPMLQQMATMTGSNMPCCGGS